MGAEFLLLPLPSGQSNIVITSVLDVARWLFFDEKSTRTYHLAEIRSELDRFTVIILFFQQDGTCASISHAVAKPSCVPPPQKLFTAPKIFCVPKKRSGTFLPTS